MSRFSLSPRSGSQAVGIRKSGKFRRCMSAFRRRHAASFVVRSGNSRRLITPVTQRRFDIVTAAGGSGDSRQTHPLLHSALGQQMLGATFPDVLVYSDISKFFFPFNPGTKRADVGMEIESTGLSAVS